MDALEKMIANEMNSYNISTPLYVREIAGSGGVPSIFNKYTVFSYSKSTSVSTNDLNLSEMIDGYDVGKSFNVGDDFQQQLANVGGDIGKAVNPNQKTWNFDYRTPTASTIISASQTSIAGSDYSLFGPMPYSWSDFLYCKHYGKIPNNYMVTLRRYPYTVYDNGKTFNGEVDQPIAQAVTWFGESTGNNLADLLGFTWGIPWSEVEAKVQDVDGNERAFGNGVEAALPGGAKTMQWAGAALTAMRGDWKRWSGQAEKEQEWQKHSFESNGPYWNQVLGPVNVINKAQKREMGLNFQHEVKLTFEYSLSSFGGVNPKTAFLDLISNFLTLTYNNAKFWGGAMRYFPNVKPMTMFLGDQAAFDKGDYDSYMGSIGSFMTQLGGGASDFFTKLFSPGGLGDIKNMLMNIGKNLMFGKMARTARPHILSIRNLLTGDPVGEWHLVVGNPLNPTACIGNLLLKDVKMELSNKLGADDFPTEVKFIVTLIHGRPRDKGDIESIFNYGNGRLMYSPLKDLPSEQGTYGDAWKGQIPDTSRDSSLGGKTKKITARPDQELSVLNPGDTAKQLRNRIAAEWGPAFANDRLGTLFSKTKLSL